MAITTADLAADLGVDEGDVDVLLELLDERARELPIDLAGFLRDVLDSQGERTAPVGLYWPGTDEEPRRAYGLGGPDPTAPPDVEPRRVFWRPTSRPRSPVG
jgi:hypothetical protein